MPFPRFRPASFAVLSILLPLGVALPVVTTSTPPAPTPVASTVRHVALAGVDAAALRRQPTRLTVRPEVLTAERSTAEFSTVGVTWERGTGGPAVRVDVRTRTGGRWSDWTLVEVEGDNAPDDSTAEARAAGVRDGTAPLWVGPSDGVQVRVIAPRHQRPRDLRLELVDPGESDADRSLGQQHGPASAAFAAGSRPSIISRRQWGANERLRSGAPSYSPRIVMGFVHHTASTNSYAAWQAAAQVRAMYAFHTQSRGWGDIGYNFLVDKWGRVYEGRAGGVDRNVIGAHTGGFNSRTFAVSLLGTYGNVSPSPAVLTAVNRMFAWKLGINHRDPNGRTTLTSMGGGTSRYPRGRLATFHTISGHRDAGLTECPGNRAYWQLPNIRRWVKGITGAAFFDPAVSTESVPYGTTTPISISARLSKPQTWTLTVRNAATGLTVRTFSKPAWSWIGADWDLKDAAGALVPPGRYTLLLESRAGTQAAIPWTGTVEVQSVALPSGVVVKDLRDGGYKLIAAGHLVRPSAALMHHIRARGTAVPATAAQLDGLATDAARPHEGSYWRAASNRWLWLVTNGQRRALTAATAAALGLPAEPPLISDGLLTTVPVGAPWTDPSRHPDGMLVEAEGATWRLESGVRRPLTSPGAAAAWAVGRSRVSALPADLALPTGAPLGPPEGTLLALPTGSTAVISGGRLRPLADLAALGYSADAAVAATPEDLAALPLGDLVPADATVHPTGTLLQDGSDYWEVVGAGRRVVSPTLVALDSRRPVTPLPQELATLAEAPMRAPEGMAGRAADGTVRVLTGGRVVALAADVAAALYDVAALPALELADFGLAEEATAPARTDRHVDGTLVTSDGKVWVLMSGERRPVSAAAAASYTGMPVRPALPGDLALPETAPAGPMSGSWVQVPSGARFVVEDGVRREVPADVARATGLDAVPVTALTEEELLASTRLGPPVNTGI